VVGIITESDLLKMLVPNCANPKKLGLDQAHLRKHDQSTLTEPRWPATPAR